MWVPFHFNYVQHLFVDLSVWMQEQFLRQAVFHASSASQGHPWCSSCHLPVLSADHAVPLMSGLRALGTCTPPMWLSQCDLFCLTCLHFLQGRIQNLSKTKCSVTSSYIFGSVFHIHFSPSLMLLKGAWRGLLAPARCLILCPSQDGLTSQNESQ